MAGKERRYSNRVRTDLGVATVVSGSEEIRCLVVNVSSGGMALLTAPNQDLGRFLRIRASLGPGWPQVDLDAIVMWRERREGRVCWGVKFYQAPPHVLAQIGEFVRENVEESPDAEPDASSHPDDGSKRDESKSKHSAEAELGALYDDAVRSIDR